MSKRFITLFILSGWLVLSCEAQGGGGGGMQRPGAMLESAHIAYLTNALNLSPAEAQRFWPIYNQYVAEIRQARMANKINRNELGLEEAILNIKKKYNVAIGVALSPEKANQFFQAERDFGNFVQKELMQRRQMRMQNRRPLLGAGGDTGKPPGGY